MVVLMRNFLLIQRYEPFSLSANVSISIFSHNSKERSYPVLHCRCSKTCDLAGSGRNPCLRRGVQENHDACGNRGHRNIVVGWQGRRTDRTGVARRVRSPAIRLGLAMSSQFSGNVNVFGTVVREKMKKISIFFLR